MNENLNLPSFNLYFGILLVLLSILLLLRNHLKAVSWFVDNGRKTTFKDKYDKPYIYGYPISFALLLTFFIGFASGLFGIGGDQSLFLP